MYKKFYEQKVQGHQEKINPDQDNEYECVFTKLMINRLLKCS